MKHLVSILITAILCATASAQTIKTLGYNATNGQVVANTGTNFLTFTNNIWLSADGGFPLTFKIDDGITIQSDGETYIDSYFRFNQEIRFNSTNSAASTTRANLGLSTNLNALWTATNSSNARTALGLSTNLSSLWTATNSSNARSAVGLGANWLTNTNVTNFRTAVGLGATNDVTFSSIIVGDLSIGGSGYSGFGNFLDMEESALRANGSNVFSFSAQIMEVFVPITFNNTNIVSTTRTNLSLGLPLLTNTSITNFQAALFSTNTAPTNTTNVSAWTTIQIGTNAFRIPLYQ